MNRTVLPDRPLMVGCLLGLLLAGCRAPEPTILPKPKIGVVYDTNYERQIERGETPPQQLAQVWEPYVDTLSEPVAVLDWQDAFATWEVYFATNRGLNREGAGGQRETFGNEVLEHPQYGRAVVEIPRRGRGQRVWAKPPDTKSILPARLRSVADAAIPLAKFDAVQSCSERSFCAGVARQVQASRQRDLLLFVHGFNVDFDAAVVTAAQLAFDMPFNGAVVAYAWPTQGGVKKYVADEPINAASVAPFVEFLETLETSLPAETRIHIVVHSMGNRIVMQALNRLPVPVDGSKRFESVCLCAPDVGEADYSAWVEGVAAQSGRVALYCNASDAALILSKGLHAERRAGDGEFPLAVRNVETIDCSRVDQSLLGHSYFTANESVLSDLFSFIKEGKPAARRPHLQRVDGEAGLAHWVFTQHPPRILWTWNFPQSTGGHAGSENSAIATQDGMTGEDAGEQGVQRVSRQGGERARITR